MKLFEDALESDVNMLLEESEELGDATREVTALSFTSASKRQSPRHLEEVGLRPDFSCATIKFAGAE